MWAQGFSGVASEICFLQVLDTSLVKPDIYLLWLLQSLSPHGHLAYAHLLSFSGSSSCCSEVEHQQFLSSHPLSSQKTVSETMGFTSYFASAKETLTNISITSESPLSPFCDPGEQSTPFILSLPLAPMVSTFPDTCELFSHPS